LSSLYLVLMRENVDPLKGFIDQFEGPLGLLHSELLAEIDWNAENLLKTSYECVELGKEDLL